MFEQDYIMRLIKEMVRTILKLLFNIDTESPTAELLEGKEEKETLENLLDMIDAGKINEAENSLYDSIREEDVVALLELKFTSDAALSTENWMKDDVWKLKEYVQTSRLQCPLYFAVIYEVECSRLNWLDGRSTNHWAADRVTELDAGWIDGKMEFEINTY